MLTTKAKQDFSAQDGCFSQEKLLQLRTGGATLDPPSNSQLPQPARFNSGEIFTTQTIKPIKDKKQKQKQTKSNEFEKV